MNTRTSRRQHILETLAAELEASPGEKLSTARLAEVVGVSEAALYRHFASKAQMFEALIEFAEEAVFSRVNQVLERRANAAERVRDICLVVLGFAERNPGITRILVGDILLGEHARLKARAQQFFQRIETQLKQVLNEARARERAAFARHAPPVLASVTMKYLTGSLDLFVRSGYSRLPMTTFEEEWPVLVASLFPDAQG